MIFARPETCFDLMRDIRIHTQTMACTDENGLGQTITFEGTHFGLRQRLTVRVIEYERPWRFVDAMVKGSFRSFVHIHKFEPRDGGTLIQDKIIWTSPLGPLGALADMLFLKRYLKDLVQARNAKLKQIAESS